MRFSVILLLLLIPIVSAVDFPVLNDFVTDQADIISPEYEQQITSLAKQIEQETTVEIAVVTVQSLEGLSKEDYSMQLFEKYGIGKKDVDNGLLVLVSMDEREYRVEVGYGLEGLIPDASKVTLGTRILEPNFKEGEFGKGIYEMLIAVQGILNGEEEVLSQYRSSYLQQSRSFFSSWIYWLFLISIISSIFNKKGQKNRFMFIPLFLPGSRWNGGSGGFGSSGFGGFGGGLGGGGGFGGNF
ncbi:TPM domain-containing protein [Candidatus Woesearchaeota archaeon]|nr:TPM domain-containing protein [Candidatus Woesearchaeota archaeon]